MAAAFPYIDLPTNIGPINLFGILLAVGVLFGSWMGRKYCERNGLDEEELRWLGIRLIVWGFIGSFVLNTVFYEWHAFSDDPWKVIKKLGISSYGAVVSGAIAFFYYSHVRKLDRRRWADMMAWGGAGGWLFGRLGCAVVHDHVGYLSDASMAVAFPAGKYPFDINPDLRGFQGNTETVFAHDLGLYEFFLWCAIILVLVALERWKGRKPGMLLGVMAVMYSVPRFLMEFLRPHSTDPRYAGLTFAQWASIATLFIGFYLIFGPVKKPVTEPDPEPPEARVAAKKKKKKK